MVRLHSLQLKLKCWVVRVLDDFHQFFVLGLLLLFEPLNQFVDFIKQIVGTVDGVLTVQSHLFLSIDYFNFKLDRWSFDLQIGRAHV